MLENGIEQGLWLPAALGEQPVFRGPIPELPSQYADGSADSATAQADPQSQGVFLGTTEGPMIRKATPPAPHLAQAGEPYHRSPLRLRQYGKRVGAGAHEAVSARDSLGEG